MIVYYTKSPEDFVAKISTHRNKAILNVLLKPGETTIPTNFLRFDITTKFIVS
jgi:hypothetical protein